MTALSSNNFLRDPQIVRKIMALSQVAQKMRADGLSEDFIYSLFPLSIHYEGAYDLAMMWGKQFALQMDSLICSYPH
jgi:hypothetical protein